MQEEQIREDEEVEAIGASIDYVGQTIEASKVKYQWHFRIAGVNHRVEFFHSKISGRKKILMDGQLIYAQQQLRSAGFEHSWPLQGHLLSLIYEPHLQAFALRVNGLGFQLFYRPGTILNSQHDASLYRDPPSAFAAAAPAVVAAAAASVAAAAPPAAALPAAAAAGQFQQQQQPMASRQRQTDQQPYQQQLPQPQQQQQQQQQQAAAAGPVALPLSANKNLEEIDLLDLAVSSGSPSPRGGGPSAAATATGCPSSAVHLTASGAPSSDTDLEQLNATYWLEGPLTPDFLVPKGPPEGPLGGPPEGPLPGPLGGPPEGPLAGPLEGSAGGTPGGPLEGYRGGTLGGPPWGPQGPLLLPQPAAHSQSPHSCNGSPLATQPILQQQQQQQQQGSSGSSSSSSCGTWGPPGSLQRAPDGGPNKGPRGAPASCGPPTDEKLFADLMDLASDKLNISLSPRRQKNPKP
ncbi:hypothetical protein, conserved [Eimeria tenella]|uniref:Uncharacterized protein n=1 Tax=Eimeria tenella TaxID=5802 RepID=U6KR51_EIMTE|nr:hypothetical protein, conserved [Eimeria tenella]CDJ38859.1 hypothetical protein, conserved [Eimeria tenella]|eukprot:XP_013229614.1 hypothetical protein, conserved [Eimeria tenella]